ncbi:MAG: DNA adenine methylase [Rhodospirillaceae bacterium]|nr:DNA adenine methylase [Rhodospirillaceae bacterium]MBL6930698.1 DNA adenine methylase [Rhodospirillales bacterium]MBL6940524.1 DNA adenine methylase [Rhodospirillales bacterium]
MYTPVPTIKSDSLAIAMNPELGFQHVSPLQYMGGKARHIRYLSTLMPANIDYLFDAFMGGLSTTIFLIKTGRVKPEHCYAGDVSTHLLNFYNVLKTQYEPLTLKLASDSIFHSNGSRHLFNKAIDVLRGSDDEFELARAFYIFNKIRMPHVWDFEYTAFSPSKVGPNAGITIPQILRLPLFAALVQRVAFSEWDYTDALNQAAAIGKNAFVFLDPPYELVGDELYGVEFDFDEFAEQCHAVAGKCTFMITINDSPENRMRFSGYNVIARRQHYSGSHKANGDELVICNYELSHQAHYLNRLGYQVAA